MCGRVNVSDNEGVQALMAMLGMPIFQPAGNPAERIDSAFHPRWNISPSSLLTAVVSETLTLDAPLSATTYRWGIPAPWAEPGKSVRPLINARSETLFSKPTFRDLARAHRAIVPVNGFYEWQRLGDTRIPYYVQVSALPAMLLAVVYEPVSATDIKKETLTKTASPQMGFLFDEPVEPTNRTGSKGARATTEQEAADSNAPNAPPTFSGNFAVVTTEALGDMARVHHRTPVILSVEQAKRWLYSEDLAEIQALMLPESIMDVRLHRVSSAVNSTRNDGPECSLPAAQSGFDPDQ